MPYSLLRHLTDCGDTAVTVPLAILMFGFLALAGERRLAVGWAIIVLAVVASISGMKLVLGICGPALIGPALRSPSGHTAISLVVYGGYAAIVSAAWRPGARLLFRAAAILFALGIAVSRVVLRVHSPAEVAVGIAVGSIALAVLYIVVARSRPGPLRFRWLAMSVAIAFLLFYGDRWPAERALHRFAALFDMIRPWCT